MIFPTLLALALALTSIEPDVALEDLGRFPSLETADGCYEANRLRRDALARDFGARPFRHQREEVLPWLAWYDDVGDAWLDLAEAHRALLGWTDYGECCDQDCREETCRAFLRELRQLLGRAAYERGEMPAPALPAVARD